MSLEEIIDQVGRIMTNKVRQDPTAFPLSDNEIEKKVDYILSEANEPLVLKNDDFLKVKGAFINRVRFNRMNRRTPDYDLTNRITELLGTTGGRRTHRKRKSRRTRKIRR